MVGKQHWAIAEGYVPETSHGPEPEMTSRETVCILNTNGEDAHVESDVPVVCQPTRLDSRQAENALLTTVPYASGE